MRAIKFIAFTCGSVLGSYGILYAIRQTQLLKQTSIEILSLKKNSIGLLQTSLQVTLRIINNSDIGFHISNQQYDLLIEGNKIGAGYSSDQLQLRPKSNADTTISIALNNKLVLEETGKAVAKNSGNISNVNVLIKGRISGSTGKLLLSRIPINISFKLSEIV